MMYLFFFLPVYYCFIFWFNIVILSQQGSLLFTTRVFLAERGRSVLVMRARYRSAGLTPHQRGWTNAGWRHHGCDCVMDRCKCSCFCTTLREKARCILHHCIPPASLSYAQGHHGLHGARVMLSVRIADPLSGRRAGS